uniref:Si:dkey-48p11.3 n=1 Tax=Salarias fasciatus TaxID=181472 RepID=A0A672IMU8_SALFA
FSPEMDLKGQRTSSKDLLSCGNGAGLSEKLLLRPKAATSLQTERVPRSAAAQLPARMAEANQRLKQQMDRDPDGRFDIEDVEEAEKDVALFELSGSESSSEDGVETSDSEDEDDDDNGGGGELTEENLKLPGARGHKRKAEIQVLEQPH